MDEQLIALYHRHVGMAFDRQLRLGEFLDRKAPGEDWEYDVTTATLAFGKVMFEAPLLGSHAEHNDSWLWAWSNKNIKLTVTNRALGDAVRMLVHRLSVHQLGAAGFSLEPLLGPDMTEYAPHVLGIVLTPELGYDAYYLTPYDGGRGLVVVRDDRLKVVEKHPLVRVAVVFPQALDAMPVSDHKAALAAYARDYALAVTEVPGGLKIAGGGKDELTATFDDRGRLAKLEGVIIPPPKPARKPTKKPTAKPAKKVTKKPAKVATKKPTAKPAKSAAKAVVKKPAKPTKSAKKTTKKR